MTDAQKRLQGFKNVLGGFVNVRPREFDTIESTGVVIDRAIGNLEALRPQKVEVEVAIAPDPQESLDLTSETETEDDAPKARKRKTRDPNRMHKGGRDRSEG